MCLAKRPVWFLAWNHLWALNLGVSLEESILKVAVVGAGGSG